MSLKQEIETWVEALKFYDAQDYDKALESFEKIADTSKIWFNIGMIYATLGEHKEAIEAYKKATKLDQFLAVAYFQQGVSNFLLFDYEAALANFNEALLYLRGNTQIDYEQLGLKFRLYSCEVLFNRGLCYIYSGQEEEGMSDLRYASKEQKIEDHKVIDEAIQDNAVEYTVFSIPVGTVYRPNEAKVRNVKQKDYLGKARLVAATDRSNAFTGFSGIEVKKAMDASSPVDDRKNTEISFAASNLVKTELINKESQQVGGFPPTPPPEKDLPSRGQSVKSGQNPMSRGMSQRAAPSARQDRADREYGRSSPVAERREAPRRNASTVDRRSDREYVPRRAASTTSTSSRSRAAPPPPREAPRRRQPAIEEYSDDDGYEDELYDMYRDDRGRRAGSVSGSTAGSRRDREREGSRRGAPAPSRSRYDDDDRYASDAYEGSSLDEDEFEMLDSRSRGSTRRAPDIKKIKVKCHNGDDTRVIMISSNQEYREFMKRLKDKFQVRNDMKCKIKDEDGDGMISLFDQEDLDMAIANVKAHARKEKLEMGKMEIWVVEGK